MRLAKKLIFVGIDGAIYDFVEKFSNEGKLPNLTRLMKDGASGPMLPVPPCDTPTNWTSLVTGAWSGTHGITGFNIHLPGDPLDKVYSPNDTSLCEAEYIWNVAERLGKKCILLNYPFSWPPTIKKGIVVAGGGPEDPKWRINFGTTYATEPLEGESQVTFDKTDRWKNAPESYSPLLEAAISLTVTKQFLSWTGSGWEVKDISTATREGLDQNAYNVLVIDSRGKGYDKIIISKEKDASKLIATLRLGEWSDWINETFHVRIPLVYHGASVTAETKKENYEGVFRFKLVELSPDAKKFLLYRTDVFVRHGWSYPSGVEKELDDNIGPYTDSLELPPRISITRNDWQTYYEQLRFQVDWFVRAADFLTKSYEWDLLFVQIHVQDGINHELLSEVYPGSPTYDPKKAEEVWKIFEKAYQATDEMVGKIVKCTDNETLVVVVSDHGALPALKRSWPGVALIRNGLLAYKKDPESGQTVVDWSKTKALPWIMNVWINLKGRDPDGIVNPEDYDKVVDQAINAIYSMRDPDTGACPFALVLRKEDAQILGLWGNRVADIVYFFNPGYTDADVHRNKILDYPVSKILEMKDVEKTAMKYEHLHYLPTARLSPCSNNAVLIMCGPGVKKGCNIEKLTWTVDVTPTICCLLGIPLPADAEGKVIWSLCETTS